ncbi:MAG TPA: hypothetical protein VNF73_11770 [Candidatus Saccharimonadales bacterium]|nr:hypothetical protein [Candidatus Saccharimonadales bacterium]
MIGAVLTGLAVVAVAFWTWGFAIQFLGQDANSYLAAGERLNVGHTLYGPLQPGDRAVLFGPPYWTAPLVSPPLIAVLWRPFATPAGLVAWMIVDGAAVLAVCGYVLLKRLPLLLLVASMGVGLQLAAGNVSGFLVGGILLLWTKRDRSWVGALLALMIGIKLLPATFLGFTARRRQTWPWIVGGLAVSGAISLAGAGVANHLAYPSVVGGLVPYPASLGAWTGLPWLIYPVIVAGMVAGYVLPERWAFVASLAAFVLGAPGLGLWTPLYLLALAGPLAENSRSR